LLLNDQVTVTAM